jgi:signal transduction histidine kinase
MSDPSLNFESAAPVPLPRLVNFVRQITHDVRNGLNALDLQAALIAEVAGEGEVAEELGKLRKIVCHITRDMQELSGRFEELKPVLMEYPVQELLQGLKEAVEEEFETQAKRIVWEVKVGAQEMEMDYALLTNALMELTRNAILFREGDQAIHFTAWNQQQEGNVVFEVRQGRAQPVTGTGEWGRAPLTSSRRGGYGLGLFYVRRVLDSLGGTLNATYDPKSSELRVRLVLPIKAPGTTHPGTPGS